MVRDGESLVIGGTSVGAPAMAGLLALAIGMRGEPLGSILPALYEVAADAGGAFHDVVDGSNGFAALPGFDLATGWGTPIAEQLVPALAAAGASECEPAFACTIPGASAADGCLVQWRLPGMSLAMGARDLPARRQRCRDGEPCDLDGVVNKSCTIGVSLCVNVVDPRLRTKRGARACTPRPVGTPRIVRPGEASGPIGAANRRRLEESLATLPPPPIAGRDTCTAPVPVDVPVPVGSSYGTATLRVTAAQKHRPAKAKVTLVCERVL
jgi:hypothetical protein